jgi:hypothetical protein
MMLNNCTPISKQHLYGNLANFETEKQIGQGQFSQVFKARCLLDNRVVALKRMKVCISMFTSILEKFDARFNY